MKNIKMNFSYVYIILFISILCLLTIFYFQSKKINESFENDIKVNLTCNKDDTNIYNCKEFEPKTKIIKQNYPQLKYESGISNQTSNQGIIQFKTKFDKIPSIYITPFQNNINKANNEILNVNIINPSKTGFSFIKHKIETGLSEEFSDMVSLDKDNLSKFNWLAIEQN